MGADITGAEYAYRARNASALCDPDAGLNLFSNGLDLAATGKSILNELPVVSRTGETIGKSSVLVVAGAGDQSREAASQRCAAIDNIPGFHQGDAEGLLTVRDVRHATLVLNVEAQ